MNCHAKSALDVAHSTELRERMQMEYKGHLLLEACRQADPSRVKKCLSAANASTGINDGNPLAFKHPYSWDAPLHCACASPFPKRKAVVEMLCR